MDALVAQVSSYVHVFLHPEIRGSQFDIRCRASFGIGIVAMLRLWELLDAAEFPRTHNLTMKRMLFGLLFLKLYDSEPHS
ncbi:hypothetical protein HDU98_005227, partial [Podochytrium sp. JEL0797]